MENRIRIATSICTMSFETTAQFDKMERTIEQAKVGLITESEAISIIRSI